VLLPSRTPRLVSHRTKSSGTESWMCAAVPYLLPTRALPVAHSANVLERFAGGEEFAIVSSPWMHGCCIPLMRQPALTDCCSATPCSGGRWQACHDGDEAALRAAVKSTPTAANFADEDGQTPLYLAASTGQLGMAKLLVELGAQANSRSPDGMTALVGLGGGGGTMSAYSAAHMGCSSWLRRAFRY
jgi:hypothetical protein